MPVGAVNDFLGAAADDVAAHRNSGKVVVRTNSASRPTTTDRWQKHRGDLAARCAR
jgi:hypothetical protein